MNLACFAAENASELHRPPPAPCRSLIGGERARRGGRDGETHNGMEESLPLFRGLNGLKGEKTREWKVRDKKVIFFAAGSESLGRMDRHSVILGRLSRDSKSAHFDSANLDTIHLHQHSHLKTNI